MPFMIFPIISFVPDERQEVEEPVEVTVNPQEVEMPVMKNAFSNPDLPEGEEACGSPTHFQDYIPGWVISVLCGLFQALRWWIERK